MNQYHRAFSTVCSLSQHHAKRLHLIEGSNYLFLLYKPNHAHRIHNLPYLRSSVASKYHRSNSEKGVDAENHNCGASKFLGLAKRDGPVVEEGR